MNNWEQYIADEPSDADSSLQPAAISSAQQEPVNWDKYSVESPSLLKEGARHVTRTASRIGETIAGIPGAGIQLAKAAGDWLEEKVPLPASLKGKSEANFVQRYGQQLVDKIPTSEDLKDITSKLTNGFTDPQSAAEEFGDDITELAALLFGDKSKGAAKAQKVVPKLLTAVGKAFGAKASGKVAEAYGVGETGQFLTEMGTIGLMSLINGKTATQYANGKIAKAKRLVPQNQMLDTRKLTKGLESLEVDLSKGLSTATKNEVKSAVSEIRGKVSGGSYPATEVMDMVHDINERMSSKKLFDELSSTEARKLKHRYGKAKTLLLDEVQQVSRVKPEAYKLWLEGMEGHATINQSQRATKFLEKHVGKLPSKVAQGIGIELVLGHPQAAGATAGAFAALKTTELMYRVMNSPALRKHYSGAVAAAATENLATMTSELSKLEAGLQKSIVKDVAKKP